MATVKNPEGATVTYHINTALMWVIVMQMFAAVWWIANYTAKADERLKVLESQQQVMKDLPERLARQEQQLATTNETLKDIRDEFRAALKNSKDNGAH
jgi:uncharacterized coiled-coil protein SlyX